MKQRKRRLEIKDQLGDDVLKLSLKTDPEGCICVWVETAHQTQWVLAKFFLDSKDKLVMRRIGDIGNHEKGIALTEVGKIQELM